VVPADDRQELKTEELAAIIEEIRNRVRARYPDAASPAHKGGAAIPLPDLMPLVPGAGGVQP